VSECCPESCACQDWLTSFCDYVTVTHNYCGTSTVFEKARTKQVPVEASRADAGVNPADCTFEFSKLEHEVESGIGAIVTDGDNRQWIVYKVQQINLFCLTRVWARNIELCFGLLGRIDVYDAVPCETDCGASTEMRLIGRIRGNILPSGGSQGYRNDSDDMVVQYTATVERWPFGEYPKASHRLKSGDKFYRVSQFTDGGPFVPYSLSLTRVDSNECQI